MGVAKFIKKFQDTGNINRRVGSGRPSKVTSEIKQVVEEQMQQDDETTAVQPHCILTDKGYRISLRTILAAKRLLDGRFEEVPIASIFVKVTK